MKSRPPLLINLIGTYKNNLTGYGIFTKNIWEALARYNTTSLQTVFTDIKDNEIISRNIALSRKFQGKVVKSKKKKNKGTDLFIDVAFRPC